MGDSGMRIAVYCSAKDQIPDEYKSMGMELGRRIALAGHDLVYGGATGGLMTMVSEGFRLCPNHPGKIIGVIPKEIIASGRMATTSDEIHKVENMSQRKQLMREIADMFICLPGSYGTLDEMMDVISSGTIGEHRKPLWIVDYQGFYHGLRENIQRMKQLEFLPQEERYQPHWVNSIDEINL